MLYTDFTVTMTSHESLLKDIDNARAELDPVARIPDEYTGELRRHVLAESVHYSTMIEGNQLTFDQVGEVLSGAVVRAPEQQIKEVENYKLDIDLIN